MPITPAAARDEIRTRRTSVATLKEREAALLADLAQCRSDLAVQVEALAVLERWVEPLLSQMPAAPDEPEPDSTQGDGRAHSRRVSPAVLEQRREVVHAIIKEGVANRQTAIATEATRRGVPMMAHHVYHVLRSADDLFESDNEGGWRIKIQQSLPRPEGTAA